MAESLEICWNKEGPSANMQKWHVNDGTSSKASVIYDSYRPVLFVKIEILLVYRIEYSKGLCEYIFIH